MANYGKPEYWEDRYQKDKEQFDWLQRYDNPTGNEVFRNAVNKYVQPNDAILIPGCGNCKLTEEMFTDGFQNITSIDWSYTVIKAQNDEYKDRG